MNLLLKEAVLSYKKEVLAGKKMYHLFAKDFLNSHFHTDRRDAKGMNEHRMNFGVLEGILNFREDLLRKYALAGEADNGRMQELLYLYYTTTPPPNKQDAQVSRSSPADRNITRPLSLGCCLDDDQMSLIAHCVNEALLFEEVVDSSMLRSLLEGRLDSPLHACNNRLLAFFFDQLSRHGFILSRWEHLLGQAGSILGSKGKAPLTHAQFSNALTHAKSNPNSMQEKIRQYIIQVKKMGENAGPADK